MPELPEVQTIVDDLNKKVVGRRITGGNSGEDVRQKSDYEIRGGFFMGKIH